MAAKKSKDLAKIKESDKAMGVVKDYRQEMAEYAKDDGAREPAAAGNNISIRGGEFTLGGEVVGDPMRVIVLDYVFENAFYDMKYDKDNPSPPACFAVSRNEKDMAPDESSPKPQAANCAECENNQFGTADVGKGKACKNQRRLALINADVKSVDEEYAASAEVAFIRLPPSSLKLWKGYVRKLTEGLQLPLFSVVTELSIDPDSEYPVIIPSLGNELPEDRDLIGSLVERRNEIASELLIGYDVSNYEEPTDRKSKKKAVAIPAKKTEKKRSKF